MSKQDKPIPPFKDLPLRKGDPFLSAWGLYGEGDQLGMLNRLTEGRVLEGVKEVREGVRISLNAPLPLQTKSGTSFFNRALFHQTLIRKSPRVVNDDVWTFNTQVSTQWDGLRHFAYQREGLFYGGVTMDDIHAEGSVKNGIQVMAEKGIVGRGILLDYHSWRLAQNPPIPFDSFSSTSIPLSHLLAVAESQGTEIKFGDILILRTGFFPALEAKSEAEVTQLKAGNPPSFGGVEQSMEMVQWIWENFSAVASDHPTFECWPTQQKDWSLHEVLLAGWGCPIGELFDLEKLAVKCKELKKWSFFLVSEPCNVPGGVASPPNVLAIL
ncbi:hypothetical protein B7463_g2415, partial [Scytalidium lignicola]